MHIVVLSPCSQVINPHDIIQNGQLKEGIAQQESKCSKEMKSDMKCESHVNGISEEKADCGNTDAATI